MNGVYRGVEWFAGRILSDDSVEIRARAWVGDDVWAEVETVPKGRWDEMDVVEIREAAEALVDRLLARTR